MKIGIIIIFNNNETHIEKNALIKHIKSTDTLELCLVDNNSTDKTLQILQHIKEACDLGVSIVEIKKGSSAEAAKRAGARYMFHQFNLKHIGFINVNSINLANTPLNTLIECAIKHHEQLIDYNLKITNSQNIKQTLFKSVFSVAAYLERIEKPSNLTPSIHIIH